MSEDIFKKQARARADSKCEGCRKATLDAVELEAHHARYPAKGSEDLVVLCRTCHDQVTRSSRLWDMCGWRSPSENAAKIHALLTKMWRDTLREEGFPPEVIDYIMKGPPGRRDRRPVWRWGSDDPVEIHDFPKTHGHMGVRKREKQAPEFKTRGLHNPHQR